MNEAENKVGQNFCIQLFSSHAEFLHHLVIVGKVVNEAENKVVQNFCIQLFQENLSSKRDTAVIDSELRWQDRYTSLL